MKPDFQKTYTVVLNHRRSLRGKRNLWFYVRFPYPGAEVSGVITACEEGIRDTTGTSLGLRGQAISASWYYTVAEAYLYCLWSPNPGFLVLILSQN